MNSNIPLNLMRPVIARSSKPVVKEKASVCYLCPSYCGVVISLDEDERIVKVVGDKQNPNTEGFICNKGVNLYTSLDSPQRLTQPLKRVNGQLQEVSWDEALDGIAAELKRIRKERSARSLGIAFGGAECRSSAMMSASMLMNSLGSRSIYNPAGLEFLARYLVAEKMYGAPAMDGYPDFEHTEYAVIIGGNPLVSSPPQGKALKRIAKDAERTLVVIDPRRTETAKIADRYLGVIPSTDVYFLLAMLNIIITEGLYDHKHVADFSQGLELVKAAVAPFTPEVAERMTAIPAKDIIELARGFGGANRAVLYYHMGVIANHHATLVAWLVQTIKFITHNKGQKGGSQINPLLIDMNKLYKLNEGVTTYQARVKTQFGEIANCLPTTILAEEILTPGEGQIRAMIVSSCNPLKGYGDTASMEQAFDDLELLVSIDAFLTEVGRKADYVLPCCGYQEQENIAFSHPWLFKTPFIHLVQKIREPRGESWPEWKIYRQLLKRTGPEGVANKIISAVISGFELWHQWRGTEGGYNQQLGMLKLMSRFGDVNWKELENKSHGFNIERKKPYSYLENLGTSDKKVHLAIPEFIHAVAQLPMLPELEDQAFPLRLSTLCRSKANTNTMFHNAAWQLKNTRENDLKIHPQDIEFLTAQDGDRVRLVSERAEDIVTIHITEDVIPGSIHLTHGWGLMSREINSDEQTLGVAAGQFGDLDKTEVFTGMPLLSGIPCRIEAVG